MEPFESLINNQQYLYSFNHLMPSFFDNKTVNFPVNTLPDQKDRMTPQ